MRGSFARNKESALTVVVQEMCGVDPYQNPINQVDLMDDNGAIGQKLRELFTDTAPINAFKFPERIGLAACTVSDFYWHSLVSCMSSDAKRLFMVRSHVYDHVMCIQGQAVHELDLSNGSRSRHDCLFDRCSTQGFCSMSGRNIRKTPCYL